MVNTEHSEAKASYAIEKVGQMILDLDIPLDKKEELAEAVHKALIACGVHGGTHACELYEKKMRRR